MAKSTKIDPLLARIRTELAAAADRAKAGPMQEYMRSSLPYHGVPAPRLRVLCKSIFGDVDFVTRDAWERQVLALWRGAQFREERYCAIERSGIRAYTNSVESIVTAVSPGRVALGKRKTPCSRRL